ncbi:MAG: M20/M25/M40 family metallo-hydrolase [Gemmatimonadaceae bacterium]
MPSLRVALAAALLGSPLLAQPSPDRVRAAARSYREAREAAILRELVELLAIPNLASDSANIRRNAHHLVAMLERRGVRARLLEAPGSPPAVFGELTVPGATRTIVYYAHYDGQPVQPAQWSTTGGDPWRPTLYDRAVAAGGRQIPMPADGARVPGEARVYARSASDDKSPIVAMLTALDALRAAGLAPSTNVRFFFDGEEEAGSEHAHDMLTRHAALLGADLWIFGDGPVHQSGRRQVVLGVRGTMGLELTTYGPARMLHSGHYGNWAPNPAIAMARLLASLRDDEGRILIAGFQDDVRPLTAADRAAIRAMPPVDSVLANELALGRTEASPALLAERIAQPALNVRGIQSGAVGALATNAIPTEARASIDFRLVPAQTPERVRALVEAHLRREGWTITHDSATAELRRRTPRLVRLEWESGYPGVRTAADHPAARAVAAVLPDAVVVPILGGSLPMYHFADVLKTPVLVVPIVNYDNNQHAANENLRMQNLWDGIESYAALFARLGAEWRAAVP